MKYHARAKTNIEQENFKELGATKLAKMFKISRYTVYKWLKRDFVCDSKMGRPEKFLNNEVKEKVLKLRVDDMVHSIKSCMLFYNVERQHMWTRLY